MGVLAAFAALPASQAVAGKPAAVRITDLSDRADLVSGGDALIKVRLPARPKRSAVSATVGGRDVTRTCTHAAPASWGS